MLQVQIREGLARLDGGELNLFELDELIHHYTRAAQKLWSFRSLVTGMEKALR